VDDRRERPIDRRREGDPAHRDTTPAATGGSGRGLQLTLDQVENPAFLVNHKFELEWINEPARTGVLGGIKGLAADITERNLFSAFLGSRVLSQAEGRDEIMRFHLSIAKSRMSKTALLTLDPEMADVDVDTLSGMYDETEPAKIGPMLHTEVNLAPAGESEQWHDVYASFFREGVFFVFSPSGGQSETLMQLLARRDIVIRDLLKKRRPYLTPLAVLVADLQDSMKICAELPPEEYFELINDIWGVMDPMLRKYYATHGKHVGDGMVYYFFPQPDCNYVLNAINCAHEMKDAIGDVCRDWRKRKNWMNDLQLNIGLVEGQEWFGTYQTPTHLEFTVLGDTINIAGRLSDFARSGSIWITKAMLGKLTTKERDQVSYGIHRKGEDGSHIVIPNTFSRISNLIDLDDSKNHKFRDIAVMPVAEILDVEKIGEQAESAE